MTAAESENVNDPQARVEETEIVMPEQMPASRNGSIERSQSIVEIIDELSAVQHEIETAREATIDKNSKLEALRENMGVPRDAAIFPAHGFDEQKITNLERHKDALISDIRDWVAQHGKENLPPGIIIESGNGSFEARGGSSVDTGKSKSAKEKRGDLESRMRWLSEFSQKAIRDFENVFRADRATSNAANLRSILHVMKLRVPTLIEKQAEDYLNGKLSEPPFASVWVRWKISSPLDRFIGRPVQISHVEIVFDDDAATIADTKELDISTQTSSDRKPQPPH